MRTRQLLPAALALAVLVVLSGCANGSGLRVEGADAPATYVAAALHRPIAGSARPRRTAPKIAPATMTLPEVRVSLLADKRLDPFFRQVLRRLHGRSSGA